MTRHVLDIDDLTRAELHAVLDRAAELKSGGRLQEDERPLENRTLAMLFEKPSTRTRTSFETGMTRLGGHAIFLGPDDIHLGHGEPIKDTSRALSGYVDAIMARLFDHEDAEDLAAYADVPVINGLTDDAHPCQTLADLLTIRERFGGFEDVSVAWVGDGNNVASSFAIGAAMVDLDLTVATPADYALDESVLDRCEAVGSAPATTTDPDAAIADADVIYTDVWVSMGEEDERDQKLAAFEGFQITADWIGDRELMHCLPAHRGEEVTDGAVEHSNSVVWQQAENRMHAQNGLLTWLLA
ncbi:ornithine carbamoyltransferase [Halococcoides cellulosivorans]|uniref:Ornithine carbamoyltransferase n=1 Tax=Halococcoides cellulosivorans TaxID=1679096 RepID=A0A2R4WY67_9EURY|nr:ornithine carbamoyltransferase [Halococcoides cellulosivorans]AWB26484.1 ornithine carbamoyltransferase [Halococcoides cellulosivorans]